MATDVVIGLRSWPKGRDLIRRAVDDALEAVLEQIGKEAASDASELNNLRFRAKKINELQAENETLKSELANALEKLRDTNSLNSDLEPSNRHITSKRNSEGVSNASPAPEDGGAQKVDRAIYQRLVLKFNGLYENHQELVKARQVLEDKFRRVRDLRTGWESYSSGQQHYIRKLLLQLRENGITPLPCPGDLKSPNTTPHPAADVELPTTSTRGSKAWSYPKASGCVITPLIPSSDDIATAEDNDQKDELSLPKLPPAVTDGSSTKSIEPVLSSTQGDVDEEQRSEGVFIKAESPEFPEIVSCRNVKRKRDPQQSLNENIKPKIENSSSPLGLRGLYNLNESIDLDDIGQHIDTPRKKRLQILEEILSTALNQPTVQNASFGSPQNTQTRDAQESQSCRYISVPVAVTTPQPTRRTTALQTLSTNKNVTPQTSDIRVSKRRRQEDRVTGAHLLAGDGEKEGGATSTPELKITTPKPARRSKLDQSDPNQRLTGLLEQPSPQQAVFIRGASLRTPRVTSPQKRKPRLDLESPNIAQRLHVSAGREPADDDGAKVHRTVEIERDRPGPSKPTTRKSARISGEPAQTLPDDADNEPYRARPLNKLSLEHFKVNPNYNRGYEYAFSDVVRKKDERMCLPGCTDPTCCGDKFRKLAEIQLDVRHGRESTKANEEEEKRLLKDYLGSGYERVRGMSKDERRETLLEAMTREMANKHGRHRHAYERRKSPPGFWRADFPTTQEEEQDREAARMVIREKVRERYMAAMRPNGPWLFRDE